MRFALPGIVLVAIGLSAQQAHPPTPAPIDLPGVAPDAIVATMNGEKLTAAELKAIVASMDPRIQQSFKQNPRAFLRQLAKMDMLARRAEKAQLDLRSPLKEQLRMLRMNVLAPAAADAYAQTIAIAPEEQKKFYDANPDRFTHAHVRGIYIPFSAGSSSPEKTKSPTETEALAQAEAAVKAARGGADFIKLVKEYSKDPASVAKDGDFGTVHKSDALEAPVKKAIFSLRAGEISDPVRHTNGFFIFRLEDAGIDSFGTAKNLIYTELREKAVREWVAGLDNQVEVTFDNETVFPATPPATPASGAPAKPPAN